MVTTTQTFKRATGKFDKPQGNADDGLGTFLGVFTPTLLTILGVIMYLRFGWVVGHVGLGGALGIVLLANAITLVTTLSFSAIATNTRVGVGGAYFIISRSLGLEIGGAIGLPLYLSQVFSVTLYAFGLAETLSFVIPGLPLAPTTFVIIVLVGALSLKGAKFALRAQVPIMVVVALSIVALGVGVLTHEPVTTSVLTLDTQETFWPVFAVFFPAVTGVMAGLGLSGDLKDPRRSIPLGSLTAAAMGLVVYLGIVMLLTAGADGDALRSDPMIWVRIAWGGAPMILLGLWGAIFSSAIGSMLGAPRTLQALAIDHSSPNSLVRKLVGTDGGEPVVGLMFSLILALGAVFLGDLNAVAQVVTMFFLTVYGAVNMVAALETLSGSSTWRPKIAAPWMLSLAAGIACFAVMFLINPVASVIAISVEIILWLLFKRWERRTDWGDMRRDIYEALIRWALVKLKQRPMSARNWRPHILAFTDELYKHLDLIRFANWFSQDRGVVTVCEIIEGDVLDENIDANKRTKEMTQLLDEEGLVAFPEVAIVASTDRGLIDVVQANGLAGLQSNVVMLGWPNTRRLAAVLQILHRFERLNKSVMIGRFRGGSFAHQQKRRVIHVWWGGLQRNGDLMLLLAHLLTRNAQWRGTQIQVNSIASNENTRADTEAQLAALLPETRIETNTQVIVKPPETSIREVIHQQSARADIVFLGLATPGEGEEAAYAERMSEMAEGLGTVFFVKNASLFVGELI